MSSHILKTWNYGCSVWKNTNFCEIQQIFIQSNRSHSQKSVVNYIIRVIELIFSFFSFSGGGVWPRNHPCTARLHISVAALTPQRLQLVRCIIYNKYVHSVGVEGIGIEWRLPGKFSVNSVHTIIILDNVFDKADFIPHKKTCCPLLLIWRSTFHIAFPHIAH